MAHLDLENIDRKALDWALEAELITAVGELTPEAFRSKLLDRLLLELARQADNQK